jgi:hypothetical protein
MLLVFGTFFFGSETGDARGREILMRERWKDMGDE